MGDVLKILIECSFDNLFVLSGLAFMGLAVVGSIWKIQPGKWGRLGSATLSLILVCAGLWMHSHEHITQFKVVRLDFQAASSAYDGGCPVEIKSPGQIESSGAGTCVMKLSIAMESRRLPCNWSLITLRLSTSRSAGSLSSRGRMAGLGSISFRLIRANQRKFPLS